MEKILEILNFQKKISSYAHVTSPYKNFSEGNFFFNLQQKLMEIMTLK